MAAFLNHNKPSQPISFAKLGKSHLKVLLSLLVLGFPLITYVLIPSIFLQSAQNEFQKHSLQLASLIKNQSQAQLTASGSKLVHLNLDQYGQPANLIKYQLVDNQGIIIASTQTDEIGHHAKSSTNFQHNQAGITTNQTITNDQTILENIIPLTVNQQKIGTIMAYYDLTVPINITNALIRKTQVIFMIIFALLLPLVLITTLYSRHNRKNHQRIEHLLQLVTNNTKVIIFTIQIWPTLKVDYISPAVTAITGYHPEEFYNNPKLFFSLGSPDGQDLLHTITNGSFDFSSPVTLRCFNKDFTLLYLELQLEPIYNSKHQLVAIEGTASNITEKCQMIENLHYLGLHDPLTGLYNRVFFEKELTRYDEEKDVAVAVVICDIDGLKLTNDTFGHKAGDTLLLEAAKIIKTSFPESASIARTGGDEFTILIKDANKRKIQEYRANMLAKIEAFNRTNQMLPLSISSGFAVRTDMSVKMRTLYRLADNIMYREKLQQQQSTRNSIVQILKKALEARDFVTEGHATRLIKLVSIIAEQLKSVDLNINDLKLFAQFHDIGKVGIPDRILFKQGPLNTEEKHEMERHSEIGYKIALTTPELTPIANLILKHHEWWNGEGYPLGLKENAIPLESRILAIADAYDAMTSDRPYRKALSSEAALKELKNYSGIQFDPYLVDVFIDTIQNRNSFNQLHYLNEVAATYSEEV
ncbi:MAG TPA: diguanylate cyclase [Bacillota bacterium]|nr:diguanylate cyclase [Bacillota bacterium]HOL09973.1 diguanylate cyclase [Bacillota bacterium]HPO97972.1 diguanylate cyclase [Bacillota bacterium]